MKKILAFFVALMMMWSCALAESGETSAYGELVVGTTTAMAGSFFTDLWGSNATDVDVRTLLHGYNLVEWQSTMGCFGLDESVVSGVTGIQDKDGNRTYILVLYDDLCYSDGSPITAWDYAFSMLFRISPEVAKIGGAVNGLDYIMGAEAYRKGETNILSGLRVVGDYQLMMTIKAEYLPFFYELAMLDCTPYPISVIAPGCEVADDGKGVYIRNADETAAPRFTAELLRQTVLDPQTGYLSHPMVTSGPYLLKEYDAENFTAKFEINPYYKGNSKGEMPLIARLTVKHVTNENMAEQLASGAVGLVNKATQAETLDACMALARNGVISVSNYARSGQSFISYSCELPATASLAVRQAIAHCLDKDVFIQQYVRNYGLRVDGYYGIGQWMYQWTAGTVTAPVEEPAENADAKAIEAYEKTMQAWEAITLDGLEIYELDLDKANELLNEDGWTKNLQGGTYNPEKDAVRCKEINGTLVPLQLKLAYPEGNAIEDVLEEVFVENLKQAGIELTVEALTFTELLEQYYRQQDREYDMLYLATNFASIFDPAPTFDVKDAEYGLTNRTGIVDEELYKLALSMRKTEPDDQLGYCQKWVAFQNRWSEVLPSIPVYSNVYMDFYTPTLYNYEAGTEISWANAIIGAYLSDAPIETEDSFGDEEFEFID